MENYTYNSFSLQVEGLKVTEQSVYPVFIFLLVSYLFIMFANVGMVVLVCIEKSLHNPMYLLFCNLTFNDILGNSIMVPRLLADILVPPSERIISYYECVVQAFTTHMFATASHTVLMIGLTIRLNRCRTMITNPYCDNASLFKLSCESVFINNLYGLSFTVVLLSSSIGSMVLTYTKITAVCLTSKNKALNSKALKTCSTHLFVYLIMLLSGFLIILMHRFPQYSDYRKLCAILIHIIPSSLNPIIYGIQSKEIRVFLSNQFHTRKVFQ
ncbi:olfactory receptor 146-like [Gadus chalcogrammus]|uniref:olfactory receptor 146-like n=1 Tax=Gadus chalcogrammus TaxID=1042646 RepID=UPI0024C3AE59|nr:olfactory receptor 146-like [Gadus chalcogrammus]